MTCPNCGHENQEDDTFCSNCGERLRPAFEMPSQFPEADRTQSTEREIPAATTPPPTEPDHIPDNSVDPEWRMSSLPPPEPQKRRRWLWVLVGLIIFCVLLFCGLGVFLTTGAGQDLLDDLGTRAANIATGTP